MITSLVKKVTRHSGKLLVFLLALLLYSCQDGAPLKSVRSVNGLLDIRTRPIDGNISLNGDWSFYWQKLLSPDDSDSLKNGMSVPFPFRWDNTKINGNTFPSFGYATYNLKILLPRARPSMAMIMPNTFCSYRLYINGLIVAEDGKVASSENSYIPHWSTRLVDIPDQADSLEILLQVANFSHNKGGITRNIIIGPQSTIVNALYLSTSINLLITGCLFMGGIFFLGLYILSGKDKAMLAFALYGIIYSYHIIGADRYELHHLLPHLSWAATIHLEYLSLFGAMGCFALYTRYLYPDDVNRTIVNFIVVICIFYSLETLLLPPVYFTRLIPLFLLLMGGCLAYIPFVYYLAYKRKRVGSVYSIGSLVVLIPIFAYELFHYLNLMDDKPVANLVGYVIFFFMQSLVLSHRFAFEMKKAKSEAEEGNKAKSEFLSTMSHEVRTPLNSVAGISNLLLQNNPRTDQKEYLDALLFSAANLTSIVNDILDFSKIEAGKITFENIPFNISDICAKIIAGHRSAALEKMLKLTLRSDGKLDAFLLSGDPTRYYQVINNLVHNAIKFTANGYVEIRLDLISENETEATLKISVKDTGIGINPNKLKLIFDEFTQADSSISRSYGGTGLGLSICNKILALQYSRLCVESSPGVGSVFYFVKTFPKSLKCSSMAGSASLIEKKQHPLEGLEVLLVEDHPMNVLVARSFLEKWGAGVSVANNGQQALDLLETMSPGMILMDVHMPVMDGFEATKKIRERGITTPVIALTADIQDDTRKRLASCEVNGILSKPFQADTLLNSILELWQ